MLLGATGSQHNNAVSGTQHACRIDDVRGRNPGDPLGPVARRRGPGLLESHGPVSNELRIGQPIANEHMEETIGQGGIGSRHELKVKICRLGGDGASRIDNDELASGRALGVEVLHDRRHGFSSVTAHQQDGIGGSDVFHREGQAPIETERPCGCRRGR